MSFNNGPRTVTTGLSLLVDAADPLSYPGSGTNWTDIVTGITGSLSGSIVYASDFKGTLVVNDSSSVIIFPTTSGNFGTNSFTVELAFQPNQINGQHWLVAKNSGSFPSWGAFITGSGGSGRLTAFFNASSTVSCSMSTPTGSIVTGSNYLVDINFIPNTVLNTIYLNSELSGSVIANGSGSLTATSSLFISNRNSGSSVGTPLEIFNTKLYTPKLVAGRIRQNYNSLSTRLGLPQKSFLPIIEDGLLDLYPGASAAYSLRSLNTNYSSSAIRVRRSSDNTEQDIGFVSGGSIDITSLLSFCGSGNGFVTTWYDQSGNGRDAIQTTASAQPQIVNSGNIISENGKPIIQFDGVNDSFITNNPFSLAVMTLFSTVKSTGTTKTIYGRSRLGGGASREGFTYVSNNSLELQTSNGASFPTATKSFVGSNLILATSLVTGATGTMNTYVNGVVGTPATSIAASLGGTPQNTIGVIFEASPLYYMNGSIGELVVYNTDQSSTRTAIESNINSYYQIY